MGWFTRSVAVCLAAPMLAACATVPDGVSPNVGGLPGAGSSAPSAAAHPQAEPIPDNCEVDAARPKRQMRAAWITTVRNIDWPSKPGLSVKKQQDELVAQLDRAAELRLNAVFFHVRPTADAVYASDKEPWARYLTGKQGGDPGYDPLEFATAEAHKRGIELHAWFNPYRVGWKDPDLDGLVADHPVKRHPDWLITYDKQGFFDPGNPDARNWVTSVVLDVVKRYDVDGVHFDDYFYPYPAEGETFDDDASWEAHGDGFDDRDDWRRDNVDQLIADIDDGIEQSKPWVQFGVSPFGIWRNKNTDDSGSATSGLQSYDALNADTRAWIQAGTIDYVVPQLYWHQGFATADYAKLVPWWADEVEGTDVDLYIGQAPYRVGESNWTGKDALSRQLDFNRDHSAVTGDVYFSMKDLSGKAREATEHLVERHYGRPALPPVANGAQDAPAPVAGLAAERTDGGAELVWNVADGDLMYAVYRVPGQGDDLCALADAANLVAVVGAPDGGEARYLDADAPAEAAAYYVTALDVYRSESAPGDGALISDGE
ncbi:glycoside hydrolase family 10 protein [Nocardiopsis ansamitocini]|uniref:Glycosyl hydrolase n=1 Tax=Nocardiopsis ansamitocini TaxID=1670832 RepID=A0A9W6P218_9ACTN|nr:family 10 glycosylhydrolase [Nocardiopsis ansamitocini]GLU45775.1 glycosyl hydrolase [Nocardiopsis ansamitocini]